MLPFVDTIRVKGRLYYYYRRGGLRRRLKGEPDTPEFSAAYQALHQPAEAAEKAGPAAAPGQGTLRALIAAYKAGEEWRQHRPSTKSNYLKALNPLETHFGAIAVATIPRAFVFALRDKYACVERPQADGSKLIVPTPRRANHMVAVLSLLMTWAVDRGWRPDNPCLRPKKLRTGAGWRAWSDAEVDQFLTADTTPPELRLAAQLAAGTGQRGEDLIRMTWSAFDGHAIELVQEKTGTHMWVHCPAALRECLAAEPRRGLTILTRPVRRPKKGGSQYEPWKIDYFRHAMSTAIKDAGLTGVVTHGLRPTAAVRLAEAGCSDAQIQSVTGHKTSAMAAYYRRGADQKSRSESAVTRLDEHRTRTASAKPGRA
jgi:integrase